MIHNQDGESDPQRDTAALKAQPPASHAPTQFVISALAGALLGVIAMWLMYAQTHQVIAALFTGALTFAGVLERMWTILRRLTNRD